MDNLKRKYAIVRSKPGGFAPSPTAHPLEGGVRPTAAHFEQDQKTKFKTLNPPFEGDVFYLFCLSLHRSVFSPPGFPASIAELQTLQLEEFINFLTCHSSNTKMGCAQPRLVSCRGHQISGEGCVWRSFRISVPSCSSEISPLI